MTRLNPAYAPANELSHEDRDEIARLFRNDTWARPYRRVPEMEPLTGLERLAEMLCVAPGDLTHPSTAEEILAAFEHRRAV